MAKRANRSVRGTVSSSTGSYLGNTTNRSFSGGSGKFLNHKQKYREVRKGFGMSAG